MKGEFTQQIEGGRASLSGAAGAMVESLHEAQLKSGLRLGDVHHYEVTVMLKPVLKKVKKSDESTT